MAPVWPVATYGCESWTFKKADEYRIYAFEMKCLRRVSWTAKKTNEWVMKAVELREFCSHPSRRPR